MIAHRSAAYEEVVTLLKQVHEFIRRGEGDSAAADVLREAMDMHWEHLSAKEERLANQLSADLYALVDLPPIDPPPPPASALESLAQAQGAGQWEDVLLLLRQHRGLLTPEQRASWRALAWGALGDAETAARFHEQAARLLHLDPHTSRPGQPGIIAARRQELGRPAGSRPGSARPRLRKVA
jgi:hypothetical protein